MADFDRVFSALRNCVTEPKCRDCPWEECERFDCKKVSVPANLLLDALKLLKEQEPVEPVQHLVYTTKGWFCGACDGRLNRLGKYCSFCGRPVKWE